MNRCITFGESEITCNTGDKRGTYYNAKFRQIKQCRLCFSSKCKIRYKNGNSKTDSSQKVTPAIICHVVSSGMGASRNLTVSHEKQKIPKNLPSTRDTIMVSVIPSNIAPDSYQTEDTCIGKCKKRHNQVIH